MARNRAERRPVAMPQQETPASGWLRGIRLSGFSFVMMGILVLAVIVLAPSLRVYADQRQQVERLEAIVQEAQGTVDELKSERERWNDRTYITTQARDRLSYVMPGDISFLVINDLPAPAEGAVETAPVSTEIQDTPVDWMQSMFTSVMAAGLAAEGSAP
ncbi:MAG TPA: septum formation initiator family protein [Glaciibacter sp.]|nr:septum formation initiator family protein [Glaciibacter sp.]